ncbi:thiolase family protein [Sporomusa sphaeroides]|uniref:thiolase family protein n=1 Tax=Sporomusa sphaeroides TaxID=47679 RepID=UPI002CBE2938|nr:thiolase family protein [Sporomusa sphaeroides]HML31852.1 thiolase family protein [Sporomusa sphaeroides]
MCKNAVQQREVVVVGMARTAIGNFLGSLSSLTAVELAKIVGQEAIKRAKVSPQAIDEVLVGMVYKQGLKGNPARQVQIGLGIPVEGGAATIEQQCASGMRALEIATQQIILGKTEAALVCGCESMSNVPFLQMQMRKGVRMGTSALEDGLMYDALIDAFNGQHIAITAENVAEKYNITRQEQDECALLSQQRASDAIAAGKFKDEIVPVEIKSKKGTVIVDTDEHPRATTMEALAKLPTVFKKDGTVTPGNASGLNDGATAFVVMSMEKAVELGLKPLFKIKSTTTVGVDPSIMGIGPVYAIPKAIAQAGLKQDDVTYYEINEAFAAQAVACCRELKLDMNNVNANGSGIALGHPVGSTGLRLVMATYSELKRRGQKYGCGSLCAGGGPAMAVVIEAL